MIYTIACAASHKTKTNIGEEAMLEALKRKGVPVRSVSGRPIYMQAKISTAWLKRAEIRSGTGKLQYAGGPYVTRPNALRASAGIKAMVSPTRAPMSLLPRSGGPMPPRRGSFLGPCSCGSKMPPDFQFCMPITECFAFRDFLDFSAQIALL